MQPESSDFVYKNRDCLTLVVRQSPFGLYSFNLNLSTITIYNQTK